MCATPSFCKIGLQDVSNFLPRQAPMTPIRPARLQIAISWIDCDTLVAVTQGLATQNFLFQPYIIRSRAVTDGLDRTFNHVLT
jgi:hypothetical protein